jgi:hypothetical protein
VAVLKLKLIWKFPPKNSDHLYKMYKMDKMDKMPPKSRAEQRRQVAMFQLADGEGNGICDHLS